MNCSLHQFCHFRELEPHSTGSTTISAESPIPERSTVADTQCVAIVKRLHLEMECMAVTLPVSVTFESYLTSYLKNIYRNLN
jgi:hypothetical protein